MLLREAHRAIRAAFELWTKSPRSIELILGFKNAVDYLYDIERRRLNQPPGDPHG